MRKVCKEIVLGVTGGIACFKVVELASELTKSGYPVNVIMTKSAQEFVRPLTFQAITHREVYTEMFRRNYSEKVEHIDLAQRAGLVIIAPATANVIGKLAHGIADDFLTTFTLAVTCPIIIAPSMNANMYRNKIVQDNMERLKRYGYKVILPERGRLACGTIGEGRLPEIKKIMEFIKPYLKGIL